jgi:hypothetical protein
MRWSAALFLFASLAVCMPGCRSCDKVESELRAREQDVHTLRDAVNRLECSNQALTREMAALHGLPGPHGVVEKPSEPYPVRSLVVGRQTAGRAGETCHGDDGLLVVLEPRDCDNQAIKAPGAATVAVWELPEEGPKRLLAVWEVSPDELRRSWQNGLFSTGDRLTFPYKSWPTTEKLRVAARFRMINGRMFEGDRDITVRLPPASLRRTLPPPSPVPSTEAPPTQLPPPTVVPEKKPEPPPPDPPPSLPVGPSQGPLLLRGPVKAPTTVQMLRPIPLPPEVP